eukprot:gene24871-31260_t
MHGNATYYNEYAKWIVDNQFLPHDYKEEARGIIQGMKDSNVPLEFNGLDRDFDERDIYVINSYLEGTPNTGARGDGPYTSFKPSSLASSSVTSSGRIMSEVHAAQSPPACTQFVAWGDRMTFDGRTLAGRNMDGETDPAYVTVTHLIVFAVEPHLPSELRFVSVMWPGHIGTLTSMNSEGVSAMLNCGAMNTGPIATNITAIEYTIRKVISSTHAADATPERVMCQLNEFRGSEGGVSAAGSVIVFS